MEQKICCLDETKVCNNCGECMRCDLDSNKICDNCMKCVFTGAEYNAVKISAIYEKQTAEE